MPPKLAGWPSVLLRIRVPPPHVREQGPQVDQGAHTQSEGQISELHSMDWMVRP